MEQSEKRQKTITITLHTVHMVTILRGNQSCVHSADRMKKGDKPVIVWMIMKVNNSMVVSVISNPEYVSLPPVALLPSEPRVSSD